MTAEPAQGGGAGGGAGSDVRALREAFGAFATGVTVITALQPDGTPRGFTANSFTSVSLDPPLLLVCLARSAHSCPVFAEAAHFAVNILADDQAAVSGLFASRAPDKFQRCQWVAGPAGVPLIEGALARFACARAQLVEAGDHLVLIGRVEAFESRAGGPLGYFRGSYFAIGLEDRLVAAATARRDVRVGAVLASDGAVLLAALPEGGFGLPLAPRADPRGEALVAALGRQGLCVRLGALYAVFEDREAGGHGIYYHGTVAGAPGPGLRLFPLAGLPFDALANTAERHMLQRYAREFRHGGFGMYQGNETDGTVLRLEAPGQERTAP